MTFLRVVAKIVLVVGVCIVGLFAAVIMAVARGTR